MNQNPGADAVFECTKSLLSEALMALCLTRDYVGEETLPASHGWTWYDVGMKIARLIPEDKWAKQFLLRAGIQQEPEMVPLICKECGGKTEEYGLQGQQATCQVCRVLGSMELAGLREDP